MNVNAIIIGAGRSGTTSLYAYMKQHPDVYFSITKEVHYFSIPDLYARGNNYFHSLFAGVRQEKVIATADTYLLIDKEAPQRIREYHPAMKIILLLREPVARAYSNYHYSVNYGHEEKDVPFLATIEKEKERLNNPDIVDRNNLCHFYGSLYYEHISYWMQFFPKEQFIILKTEDLKNRPQETMEQLFHFLGIANVTVDTSGKYNQAAGAKSKWLQQVLLNRDHPLRKVSRVFLRPFRTILIRSGVIDKLAGMNKKAVQTEPLRNEDRVIAMRYFHDDLQLLEQKLGIRFSEQSYY